MASPCLSQWVRLYLLFPNFIFPESWEYFGNISSLCSWQWSSTSMRHGQGFVFFQLTQRNALRFGWSVTSLHQEFSLCRLAQSSPDHQLPWIPRVSNLLPPCFRICTWFKRWEQKSCSGLSISSIAAFKVGHLVLLTSPSRLLICDTVGPLSSSPGAYSEGNVRDVLRGRWGNSSAIPQNDDMHTWHSAFLTDLHGRHLPGPTGLQRREVCKHRHTCRMALSPAFLQKVLLFISTHPLITI